MSWTFLAIGGGLAAWLIHDGLRVRQMADALADRIHGSVADHLPIDQSDYPVPALTGLLRGHRALEQLGFWAVGDFDVTEPFVRQHGIHQLARLYTGPAQRTYAALACVALSTEGPMRVHEGFRLQLVSELEDGRFIYTLESDGEERVLDPPELEHDSHPVGADVPELWRHHQERLTDEATIPVGDLEALVASQEREAAYRRAHQVAIAERGLTRAEVRALGGPEHPVLARRVARQLRRRVSRPDAF